MPGRQDKQNISQCKMHNARQAEYLKMQDKQNIPIHNAGKAEFYSVLQRQVVVQCTMHNAGVQDKQNCPRCNSLVPDQQCHQNPPTSRLGYCAGFPATQCRGIASCYPAPKCQDTRMPPQCAIGHTASHHPDAAKVVSHIMHCMLDLIHRTRHSCTKSCKNGCIFSAGNKNQAFRQNRR